jgi:osmotically-inducible protein OsmY
MKAVILAVSALIWFTGCNKKDNQAARDNAAAESAAKEAEVTREAMKDTLQSNKSMVDKAKEEARQAGRDISEGTASAAAKTKEEALKAGNKVENVFLKDKGITEADAKINEKIRAALKKDRDVAKEASDINIVTENGAVSLHGTVTSASIRDEIIRIAVDVAGRTKVGSDIKVAERVGTGPDDDR